MRPADVIAKYASAEIGVLLQHRDKHAGDIDSAYWVEYPSIEHAIEAVADDLFDGRVEKMTANGEVLPDAELAALTE
ncbi:hypothetical protein [Bosea sp. NBC_00550]|uniref:hypothetical protein n=1 Tax=Bosea sp. NBC_00550 TaxID=2969621 RepID=UPI002232B3C1|nr:hypothetical protein [Bosea sp. NBC_00550]UZF90632.1 hypothetical protein NWE53_15960 [Bosea sp. NBC_00550]